MVATKKNQERFGNWIEFDGEPTTSQQLEAIVELKTGAEQFIKENKWEHKIFKYTYINKYNPTADEPKRWTIGLRCDEVLQ